jgi:hypothetical protein
VGEIADASDEWLKPQLRLRALLACVPQDRRPDLSPKDDGSGPLQPSGAEANDVTALERRSLHRTNLTLAGGGGRYDRVARPAEARDHPWGTLFRSDRESYRLRDYSRALARAFPRVAQASPYHLGAVSVPGFRLDANSAPSRALLS